MMKMLMVTMMTMMMIVNEKWRVSDDEVVELITVVEVLEDVEDLAVIEIVDFARGFPNLYWFCCT